MSLLKTLFIIISIYIQIALFKCDSLESLTQLLKDIQSGAAAQNATGSLTKTAYTKQLRPRGDNINETLTITVGLKLNQNVSLDERNQILTTNLYVFFEWNDPRLQWEKNNYDDCETITVSAS